MGAPIMDKAGITWRQDPDGEWIMVIDEDRSAAAAMVEEAGLELTEAEFEELVEYIKS